jgi:hypothetical protein
VILDLHRRVNGPHHDFVLLSEATHPRSEHRRWRGAPGSIQVSDDLFEYVYDSLAWIPTIHPILPSEWHGRGLDRWGTTILDHTGAAAAERVFSAWADLFSAGPAELELRCWVAIRPDGEAVHEVVVMDRDAVVEQMRTLAEYARRCHDTGYYLLHHGV